MTKKDYILIASAFFDGYGSHTMGNDMHAELIRIMAEKLQKENPRFDKKRFIEACGGSY